MRVSSCTGHRTRAGSSSPVRRVDGEITHVALILVIQEVHLVVVSSAVEGQPLARRYRDHSPSYVRGGAGARPNGRGFGWDELGHRPFGSDGMNKNNNPNARPREGDWF